MSSKPNPKAFMYLALGTVVVGGGLCYFQYSKLGEVNVRVAKLKTEVSDPKAVQTRLDLSNAKLITDQQSLTHLEANVSNMSYVPSLLHDLDTFGKSNGIAVTGVRPAPKKPGEDADKAKVKKPYDELIITVTGAGDFKSIENFVANLPKFPKIVAARMVSIEPNKLAGSGATTGLLNMTVDLKAYVFKSDGTAAGAAPATTPGAPGAVGTTPPATNAPVTGAGATPGTKAATPGAKPATPPVTKAPVSGKTVSKAARKVRVDG